MLFVVDDNGGLGAGAVQLGDALEAGRGDDGVILAEVLELLFGGSAQQVADEQVLGGQLVDDAEGLGVLGICAGKAVEDEDLLVLQVSDDLVVQGVEALLGDGLVHVAPCDLVVYALRVHDEFVLGGTAGVLPGLDHQSALVGQGALAAAQGVLHQLCRLQVAVYSGAVDDAELFDAVSFHNISS